MTDAWADLGSARFTAKIAWQNVLATVPTSDRRDMRQTRNMRHVVHKYIFLTMSQLHISPKAPRTNVKLEGKKRRNKNKE